MKRKKKIKEVDGIFYEVVTEITETEIPSPTQRLKDLINERSELERRIDDLNDKIQIIEDSLSG